MSGHKEIEALAVSPDQAYWTENQIVGLRHIGLDQASPADLAVFFHQVKRTGLDPFARQIYLIQRQTKNGPKQTIQTGIDGFRLIARRAVDRTGETLSISQPYYATPDGKWLDFWPYSEPPVAAKILVKRGAGEFPAVAMFNEYAARFKDGNLMGLWASKPAVMIGKCAEALALRKAFPQDLSGLYTGEEMAQADHEPAPAVERVVVPPSGELLEEIKARQAELGIDDVKLAEGLKWVTKGTQTSLDTMDMNGATALADYLKNAVERQRTDNTREEEIIEAELVTEDGDDQ